ncbi:MAG TPA: alpha-hydroxy acid oxidase [Trichormus sp.]|jgi:4-hydroxymandelate oxidase
MKTNVPNAPINVAEYEEVARRTLPKLAYDYFSSGAADELTVGRNISAFREISLRPHVLVDVSKRDLATTIVGTEVAMPIVVAPMAFQRMAHADGECATARAATKLGTIMCVSTLATCSIEEVAQASPESSLFFQLYVYKDKAITKDLVQRAEAAGYKALVLTVDSPMLGRRERDVRNLFQLPEGLKIANLVVDTLKRFPQVPSESGLFAYIHDLYDASLTWKDLEWICSLSQLPLLVKGILRGDDALRAIECGAKGIVVSNHGGRQLDTAISTIEALPDVMHAVGGRAEVLLDGGIRRGTDILKALAMGARAVLIGRPVLWGLAADGEAGAAHVLEILRNELDLAMALSGCPTLSTITEDLLA